MPDGISVAPERAPAAAAPPVKTDAAPTAKEMADLRAEVARLSKSNTELTESERFWALRAQGGKATGGEDEEQPEPKAAPAKGEAEVDEDDPAAFVEALSTKGPKAIAAYLKRQGYVTSAEAKELAEKSAATAIGAARKSLASDAELVGRYPDLKDANSELFKATAAHLKEMVADDPRLKNSPAALKTAARLATLELASKEKKEPEEKDDPEERRKSRIDAQGGSRGRRPAASFDDDDDDNHIGSQAREIMSAMGVDEKDYVAERKKLRGTR